MVEPSSAERRRRSLKPLRRLFPYIGRYRGLVAGALVSLTLAAVTTLALPVAVRRMIDHGFSGPDSAFIANYFSMLVAMAALLAAASAGRYYFVITLGERVGNDYLIPSGLHASERIVSDGALFLRFIETQ